MDLTDRLGVENPIDVIGEGSSVLRRVEHRRGNTAGKTLLPNVTQESVVTQGIDVT